MRATFSTNDAMDSDNSEDDEEGSVPEVKTHSCITTCDIYNRY